MKKAEVYFPLFIVLFCVLLGTRGLGATPPVDVSYQKYFVQYEDNRSWYETALNAVGQTNLEVGRSFALIAGVSHYPRLGGNKDLIPAAEDIRKLRHYLIHVEKFDEVVELKNVDVNLENFNYFLQSYFPQQLKQFPKSRFLFAYSGHGFQDDEQVNGYVLTAKAASMKDTANSIDLGIMRRWIGNVVAKGHHVLVLINSCYSGAFLNQKFGATPSAPEDPGAWAIMAGGSNQLTWHQPEVGSGSVFFEKVFAGLDRRADLVPKGGDGIITTKELNLYLEDQIPKATGKRQHPKLGDLSKHGDVGGFFFLDRRRQIREGNLTEWNPGKAFGEDVQSSVIARGPSYSMPQTLPKTITGEDGAAMVLVPEGTFWMGSSADMVETVVKECLGYDHTEDQCRGWIKGEMPRHKVSLKAFYMDAHEVTNRLFEQFVNDTTYQTTAEREGEAYAFVEGKGWELVKGASWQKPEGKDPVFVSNRADHPVVSVSWDDAYVYCDKYGKRLPTEAEWEYAARAGTATRNWWGNAPPASRRVANIADVSTKDLYKNYPASYDDGFERTAPVGAMAANPWGLSDMIGNVWEWTSDWYGEDFYSQSTTSSPRGPSAGDYRVLRGGSWNNDPDFARSADRFGDLPAFRNNNVGFRCVQDVL